MKWSKQISVDWLEKSRFKRTKIGVWNVWAFFVATGTNSLKWNHHNLLMASQQEQTKTQSHIPAVCEQETIKHLCLVQWDNCWSPVGPKIFMLSFFLCLFLLKRKCVVQNYQIDLNLSESIHPDVLWQHTCVRCAFRSLFSLFWMRIRFPKKCKHLRNCLIVFFCRKRWSSSNSIASWNWDNGKASWKRLFCYRSSSASATALRSHF